ncbi:MAG: hypothetical protein ABIQ17_04835, partial [Candidatus Limnocylindrales bacterium]
LDIPRDPAIVIRYRDERSDLEHLSPAPLLHDWGLRLALRAYETKVLTGFREERDGPGMPWKRLAAELGDGGVPSLDEALRDLELRPIHQALEAAAMDIERLPDLLSAIGAMPERTPLTAAAVATLTESASARHRALEGLDHDAMTSALLESWLLLEPLMTAFGPGIVDELRLPGPLEASVIGRWNLNSDDARGLGSDGRAIAAAVAAPTGTRPRLAAWLGDPLVAAAIGVHAWEGADWLDGDRFAALANHVALAEVLDGSSKRAAKARATRLRRAVERAGYRVDGLRAPARRTRRASR